MKLGVDISNYQGVLSNAELQALNAAGRTVVVCGTDGNPTSPLVYPQQVAAAVALGLEVEAYIFLYFSAPDDIVARTQSKLALIRQQGHVTRVWLDCEDDPHGLAPDEIKGHIAAARDAVQAAGFECGIYTGKWWWGPNTANDEGFWNLKLWAAQYDGIEDPNVFDTFGGWYDEQPVARGHHGFAFRKQWTAHGQVPGITIELDLDCEQDAIAPAPVPAPEPVPVPVPNLDYNRGFADAVRAMRLSLDGLRP